MATNIKDWNRSEVLGDSVFHFKNSLEPFIMVYLEEDNKDIFVNIHTLLAYPFEYIESYGYHFYTKEDDEDFLGVDVVGSLKNWF